jgi:hypothetical protein
MCQWKKLGIHTQLRAFSGIPLTFKVLRVHIGMQIFDQDFFLPYNDSRDKPGGIVLPACVVMPHPEIVETSQRPKYYQKLQLRFSYIYADNLLLIK